MEFKKPGFTNKKELITVVQRQKKFTVIGKKTLRKIGTSKPLKIIFEGERFSKKLYLNTDNNIEAKTESKSNTE